MATQIEFTVPADKSISHRALIFSALAEGKTYIKNFLFAQDCLSTASILKELGVAINLKENSSAVEIEGRGKSSLSAPNKILDAGNSGTTIRIMMGVLAGQRFDSTITGDQSLQKRPMKRVIDPLSTMGAKIDGRKGKKNGKIEIFPPVYIQGTKLHPAKILSSIASAQVKSAVLLAGLYANGITTYREPIISRDHTERMFALFGNKIRKRNGWLFVDGRKNLVSPGELFIPADISSAAFFIGLGLILPKTELRIKYVGINPTRSGILDVFRQMGGKIRLINKIKTYEPYADIVVKSSNLKGLRVSSEDIPRLIDEIPILAVVAAFAKGPTYIEAVDELRVKESDRLKAIEYNLSQIGCQIKIINKKKQTDLEINPPNNYKVFRKVKTWRDHRIVMAMAVASARLGDDFAKIEDRDAVNISYPNFWKTMELITKGA